MECDRLNSVNGYLLEALPNVKNVTGGIDAYSCLIDSSINRY